MSGARTKIVLMRASAPVPVRGRPSKFDARRLELLRQAAAIFAEAGYCGATMHELAARLGVTRPALYHYAPSKEALFEQCVAMAEDALNRAVVAALEETNGRAQISAFFERYAEICAGDFGRCFVAADMRRRPGAAHETLHVARKRLLHAVAGMVQRGVGDGSIRDCEPLMVSALFFASFEEGAVRPLIAVSEEPAACARILLDLFFTGLSPPTAIGGQRIIAQHASPY